MRKEHKDILTRYIQQTSLNLLDGSFKEQTDFIEDPSKLKAAQCSRRSGKSFGMGLYLAKTCVSNPGVSCLYVALTRGSAKRIMFKDIFKIINRRYKLGMKFNELELTATFPNGSIVYFLGMDQSEKEQEKALGQKFKLAVVDESASFRTDLNKIVYSTILPALADLEGTLCLIGSTSSLTRGFFYDVTNGKIKGWSVHKWGHQDNPYTRKQVKKQIDKLIEDNPTIVNTPIFKQMYMNQWVVDDSQLVYKFTESRNLVKEIPDLDWEYVLGVDLGYNDDSAFVMYAWNKNHGCMYIVDVFKQKKMDISDVARKIKDFRRNYKPINSIIIDGANKQAVQEIIKRHKLPLITADKTGKSDFIEIMNSEFIMGNIKLLEPKTMDLQVEYKSLIWDEKNGRRVENQSCDNHATDSALYAWRYCFSYLSKPIVPEIDPYSMEGVDEFWEKESQKIANEKEKPFWEIDIF